MPSLFTEDTYEQAIIELFENMGYEHLYAPDYDRDYTSPLLDSVLRDSLVRINRGLPLDAIEEAIAKLKNFDTGSLLQKNITFMDYLQNGINGLPLVLMELKSPAKDEVGAENAYNQIRNYMQDIPSMFYYNAICVISDLSTNKAGTITSGLDRFMEWKTKDGNYEETAYAQFDVYFEEFYPFFR